MKLLSTLILCLSAVTLSAGELPTEPESKPVTLSGPDFRELWVNRKGDAPGEKWTQADNTLHLTKGGGDLISAAEYDHFELRFDFRIPQGGNAGIKYKVREYNRRPLGLEYQILGENKQSTSKNSCASIYDIYEPSDAKELNPPGEWNSGRIVVRGPHIEHWLNGKQVVKAEIGSDDWNSRIQQSKFKKQKGFARNLNGKLLLQDHGAEVWFRNLTLTPLASDVPIPEEPEAPTKPKPDPTKDQIDATPVPVVPEAADE